MKKHYINITTSNNSRAYEVDTFGVILAVMYLAAARMARRLHLIWRRNEKGLYIAGKRLKKLQINVFNNYG